MQTYQLQIQAIICKTGNFNERLSVEQTLLVEAHDFLSLCKILGQFQDLAEKLRNTQHT
jgi:hypothetical protein